MKVALKNDQDVIRFLLQSYNSLKYLQFFILALSLK